MKQAIKNKIIKNLENKQKDYMFHCIICTQECGYIFNSAVWTPLWMLCRDCVIGNDLESDIMKDMHKVIAGIKEEKERERREQQKNDYIDELENRLDCKKIVSAREAAWLN